MKLVINKCYGGFSLSPKAVALLAKKKGRECYFFIRDRSKDDLYPLVPCDMETAEKDFMFSAYDISDISVLPDQKDWHTMTLDERRASNEAWNFHSLPSGRGDVDRGDPDLVATVEELGDAANGRFARLRVVEIPDGVEYEIDEYDGIESIHEVHRSWA